MYSLNKHTWKICFENKISLFPLKTDEYPYIHTPEEISDNLSTNMAIFG